MRTPWTTGAVALKARMIAKDQVPQTEPEAEMPDYMESFLAHLRLLVSVPFNYLVPDARLLPPESIRFFYLDRSWADRLVDGAVAVGKIGTREQAHHQAHEPAIRQQLDLTERIVRSTQRHIGLFPDLKKINDQNPVAADTITGFLLRSAAVSSWPGMDVRAYSQDIPEPLLPSDVPLCGSAGQQGGPCQLRTLRLERLSPSVMLALFQGIPRLVTLEEPHLGVQFGVIPVGGGYRIDLRDATGHQIFQPKPPPPPTLPDIPKEIDVPLRASHTRVIAVMELRKRLAQARAANPSMPPQTGSASFAIEVLNPPWRQRFEGTKDFANGGGVPGFISVISVNSRVSAESTRLAVQELVKQHGNV
jgi:hypothetical protein